MCNDPRGTIIKTLRSRYGPARNGTRLERGLYGLVKALHAQIFFQCIFLGIAEQKDTEYWLIFLFWLSSAQR